jgi:hypothetical protein
MKKFSVSVDITMAKNIYVEAENEEHAKEIVDSMINNNPYGYTNGFSHFVSYEIIDANEED